MEEQSMSSSPPFCTGGKPTRWWSQPGLTAGQLSLCHHRHSAVNSTSLHVATLLELCATLCSFVQHFACYPAVCSVSSTCQRKAKGRLPAAHVSLHFTIPRSSLDAQAYTAQPVNFTCSLYANCFLVLRCVKTACCT